MYAQSTVLKIYIQIEKKCEETQGTKLTKIYFPISKTQDFELPGLSDVSELRSTKPPPRT
jgi:hypothetical protein